MPKHLQSTEDVKPEVSAKFEGLVDVVEQKGQMKFLVADDRGFWLEDRWTDDDRILLPPSRRDLPWAISDADRVSHYIDTDNDASLYDDVVAWTESASVLPSLQHHDLLASWIMHTYLMEYCNYSPIIMLYSVAGSGKSRTGKSLVYTAYRGLHLESLNPGYIMRTSDLAQCSCFFDVVDIWRRAKGRGSEDIILSRFERGARSARVTNFSNDSFLSTKFFDLFAPTVLGLNELPDETLESRSIIISMQPSLKIFNNDVTAGAATDLRSRLTAFRARHMLTGLPEVKKACAGRLGDITKPLLQIAEMVKPEASERLLSIIGETQESRAGDLSCSLEAGILRAFHSLAPEVRSGVISVKRVTTVYNESVSPRERIDPRTTGRRLKALGFRQKVLGGGYAGYIWDGINLHNQMMRYGLDT